MRNGGRRCRGRSNERGYVLLLVLTAIATMAFVIAEFAQRIDSMRQSSRGMQAYARARIEASNAMAVSTYWLATRNNELMGLGDVRGMVYADGRLYRLPSGAYISFQDQRGMLSLNFPERQSLQQLLVSDGVPVERTDAFIDTLQDYIEPGSLKRLNGASASDYAALGLPPARHDWLRSYEELYNVPFWLDDPERLTRLQGALGVRRSDWINPNTASEAVLRALFPRAAPEQIQRLLLLRQSGGFLTGKAAQLATGLDFSGELFLPFVGPEITITVWTNGLPRAIQYNVLITPGGTDGPWLVTEQHSRKPPKLPDDTSAIPVFPLATTVPGRHPTVDSSRP